MMKIRNVLILCMAFLLVWSNNFAQEKMSEMDSLIVLDEQQAEKKIFPGFYFGWSFIKPLGKYSKDQTVEMSDGTFELNRGKNLGLAFELGYFYWLDGINFSSDKIRLGVKTVYFSPQFTFRNSYDLNLADFNNSFKVGPSFAYNPYGSFVIEGNISAGPTLFYSGDRNNLNLIFSYGFEFSVRYRPIYLSLGATFGQYNLELEELKDRFEMPTTRINATFGFNF